MKTVDEADIPVDGRASLRLGEALDVEVCDSDHRRVTGNLVAGAWSLDRLRGDMTLSPAREMDEKVKSAVRLKSGSKTGRFNGCSHQQKSRRWY